MRIATHDDLDRIVSFGAEFHAYSPWRSIAYDREHTRAFCERLIDSGVIFITDHGMIGGMMNPLYFNNSFSIACELFWWAKKNGRELMEAFEAWGREQDAKGFHFSSLGDDKEQRMDQLFNRAGYRKVETGYFKEV